MAVERLVLVPVLAFDCVSVVVVLSVNILGHDKF